MSMIRGGAKLNQDEEEYDDEVFSSKRTTSAATTVNNSSTATHHGKSTDKANAIRSKHSVTEQRRRSKINERFQALRELIPHSDQKRDTASFLLEVIEYVQYLQEKVQKYEGSFQGWSSEQMKLMPWRNSHWRVQNFVGPPQGIKDDSETGPTYPGKHDENNIGIAPAMLASEQLVVESAPSRNVASMSKALDHQQPELANNGLPLPIPLQSNMFAPIQHDGGGLVHSLQRPVMSDRQSAECQVSGESLNQHEELAIQGGTINISSVYSQGLLNNLTQALQSAGVDLSQASISVQIDLGKRANRGLTSGASTTKDTEDPHPSNQTMSHLRAMSRAEDLDQAQKRHKT